MTRGFDKGDSAKGAIGRRLDAPQIAIGLRELAQIWVEHRATWRISGLGALAQDPGLCGRIRGAFGACLMEGASAPALRGEPCPWTPPCALEALWRKQGRMQPGYDHASPWLIALDPHAGDLDVTLTLFGFAIDWAAAAMEAMTRALRHCVDWRGETAFFVPKIEFAFRRGEAMQGVDLPGEAVREAWLTLLSPLALSGVDPRERPAALIVGLLARVESLARWHDATILAAVDRKRLGETARALDYDWAQVSPVVWTRGSRRQGRAVPMRGVLGEALIAGADVLPEDAASLLAFAPRCGLGSDLAFGCGRCEIAFA